jgi:hypothetical protein
LADVLLAEGRVSNNEIELSPGGGQLLNGGEDILHAHLEGLGRQAGEGEVLRDEAGVFCGAFDAEGMSRAPAETFQTECACATEQFQDTRADDAFAKAIEDGLSNQVRRGAQGMTSRRPQDYPRRYSTYDAHGWLMHRLHPDAGQETSAARIQLAAWVR